MTLIAARDIEFDHQEVFQRPDGSGTYRLTRPDGTIRTEMEIPPIPMLRWIAACRKVGMLVETDRA